MHWSPFYFKYTSILFISDSPAQVSWHSHVRKEQNKNMQSWIRNFLIDTHEAQVVIDERYHHLQITVKLHHPTMYYLQISLMANSFA